MKIINPQEIKISSYDYDLPENKIAKFPLIKRDDSKLLIYNNGEILDKSFIDISDYLPNNGLMIFNNTKVIHARLKFVKSTGANIEIFCLEPYLPSDYEQILTTKKSCVWKCMIGNAKKWKDDNICKIISIDQKEVILTAKKINSTDSTIIEFEWDDDNYSFAELLDIIGELPIPPYLNRDTEDSDNERYQTLYSKIEGSVAAPTAGLHFTDSVLQKIKDKGCLLDEVTLHVGAGTFKPVKSTTIDQHVMHSEFISINKSTIENILSHEGPIIAVGTTSVRTLESLFYIGCLLMSEGFEINDLTVNQWFPYQKGQEYKKDISKEQALQYILNYMNQRQLQTLVANTQIMILPSYEFKIVDAIVTNFHQPKSTLLLLVSAFVKGDWRTIYNHALTHEYRFLSYGDSSLLLSQD